VGHYGVFNGSRFRKSIAPRIAGFMQAQEDAFNAARGRKPARKPALRKVVG
jgi:poly-beta-hydroxyalkanoate depolymerase